jgi:protein-tyrosine-phosphatase
MKRDGKVPGLLLFVCTGNVCRSPMAEYMLRDRLGPDSPWHVTSAGTFAGYGMHASDMAIKILAGHGIDLTPHLSRPITRGMVDASSVVVVMTRAHRDELLKHFPGIGEKVFLLKHFGPGRDGDVADPIGQSEKAYRQVSDEIAGALPDLVEFLNSVD